MPQLQSFKLWHDKHVDNDIDSNSAVLNVKAKKNEENKKNIVRLS